VSWKTRKIINLFSRPGNVLEFYKVRKCPGNVLEKILPKKKSQLEST
jgi:hypothetical protein